MAQQYESTKAIRTALRELGFRVRTAEVKGITQWADFRVIPILNEAGEREYNTLMVEPRAVERMWELHEEIESRTAALGSPWYVCKQEFGGWVTLRIDNHWSTKDHSNSDLPFGRIIGTEATTHYADYLERRMVRIEREEEMNGAWIDLHATA
jgi:hypothetical protein